MEKFEKLKQKVKETPARIWILSIIILIGFFLRTYHFQSWLPYRGDQIRDAQLAGQVLDGKKPMPLIGPNMNYTGPTEDQKFHLGPIYYYFQILSGFIFGNYPDKFAYPDLLFSILSIPLFYFFLKRYFKENIALVLTCLYAISDYFIKYARFAWNTNLIPFFVLLFLYSLQELLEKKEKAPWKWAVLLGCSMGIGFQLHAILIVLFSLVSFVVFVVTMKKDKAVWKKWVVVLLAILLMNSIQIYTEFKTNFSNTKIMLNFSSSNFKAKESENADKLVLIKNDLDCHLEANALFLTSAGNGDCSYNLFSKQLWEKFNTKSFSKFMANLSLPFFMWASIILPLFCYSLLFKYTKAENKKDKKNFLLLINLYIAVFFFLMVPLSLGKLSDLRYFVPMFFVPFMLLGFLLKYISEKTSEKYSLLLIVVIVILFLYPNMKNIATDANALSNKECSFKVVSLGKIEPLVDHISSKTNENKKIFIAGEGKQEAFLNSIGSLLRKQNIDTNIEIQSESLPEADRQGFFISCDADLKKEKGYEFDKVGQFYIYQVDGAFVKSLIE